MAQQNIAINLTIFLHNLLIALKDFAKNALQARAFLAGAPHECKPIAWFTDKERRDAWNMRSWREKF